MQQITNIRDSHYSHKIRRLVLYLWLKLHQYHRKIYCK